MDDLIQDLMKQKEMYLQGAQNEAKKVGDANRMKLLFEGAAQGVQETIDNINAKLAKKAEAEKAEAEKPVTSEKVKDIKDAKGKKEN